MNFKKTDSKDSALVLINLQTEESVKIQPGAMVFHNGKVKLEGKMNGNIAKAMFKKAFTGETFFITTAIGQASDSQIGIAPTSLGDIEVIDIGARQWRLKDGAFLACDNSVDYKTTTQGISKAVLGGTGGFIVMETIGQGQMLINAYGSLLAIDLDGTQDYVVDNQHVVCWDTNLDYKIEMASGMFGFKTNEGVVCRFKGAGRVYIQTRSQPIISA
ncbi:MAG: TIGR00266 family protein [Erysipelotrichales bacterium]